MVGYLHGAWHHDAYLQIDEETSGLRVPKIYEGLKKKEGVDREYKSILHYQHSVTLNCLLPALLKCSTNLTHPEVTHHLGNLYQL